MSSLTKHSLCCLSLLLATLLPVPSTAQIPTNAIQNTQITPTTNLMPASHPAGGVWSIDQVADGFIMDVEPSLPGFVANEPNGTITLNLDGCYNLDSFFLWNDVRIQGQGIDEFTLKFFDIQNTHIATQGSFNASAHPNCCNPDTLGEQFIFSSSVLGVNRVDLEVISSHGALNIELREVAFTGEECDGGDTCPPGCIPGGDCPACGACIAGGAQDAYLFKAAIDIDQILGSLENPLAPNAAQRTIIGQERVINFSKDSGGPLQTTQGTTRDSTPVFFDVCNSWSGHNWKAPSKVDRINFILENLVFEATDSTVEFRRLLVKIKKRLAGTLNFTDLAVHEVVLSKPPAPDPRGLLVYLESGPVDMQIGDEVFVTAEAPGSAIPGGHIRVLSGPECLEDESVLSRRRCLNEGFTWIGTPLFYTQDSK